MTAPKPIDPRVGIGHVQGEGLKRQNSGVAGVQELQNAELRSPAKNLREELDLRGRYSLNAN